MPFINFTKLGLQVEGQKPDLEAHGFRQSKYMHMSLLPQTQSLRLASILQPPSLPAHISYGLSPPILFPPTHPCTASQSPSQQAPLHPCNHRPYWPEKKSGGWKTFSSSSVTQTQSPRLILSTETEHNSSLPSPLPTSMNPTDLTLLTFTPFLLFCPSSQLQQAPLPTPGLLSAGHQVG